MGRKVAVVVEAGEWQVIGSTKLPKRSLEALAQIWSHSAHTYYERCYDVMNALHISQYLIFRDTDAVMSGLALML